MSATIPDDIMEAARKVHLEILGRGITLDRDQRRWIMGSKPTAPGNQLYRSSLQRG